MIAATIAGIMTLCVVATKPIANQAFAQTPCSLTLSAYPNKGTLATGEGIRSDLTGKLSCGGTGISGATLDFSCNGCSGEWHRNLKTDDSGNFFTNIWPMAGESLKITANYGGDSDHGPATATTSIAMKEKSGGRFEPG